MILKVFARRLVAALLLGLLAFAPASATVNSSASKTIVLGNGITTTFNFSFIGVAAAYISVILTDASGNETVLTQGSGASQYQITLNSPVTGAIWGMGGTVTYNPSGTPMPAGSTLTIFRTLPLTQAISLQNQNSLARLGNGAETGLDTGVMQLQQISENIGRAIVTPIVDPSPPLPLPPVAQRANQGMGFDASGNPIAMSAPSGGMISSAMQPVVDAATLALGRTALGLGNVATLSANCQLLQNQSATGNLDVGSVLNQVSINQSVVSAFCGQTYVATGPITFALPRANTLWNGFGFWIHVVSGGLVTLTVNVNDTIEGLASGTSGAICQGCWAFVTTDAATFGNWRLQISQGYMDITNYNATRAPVLYFQRNQILGSGTSIGDAVFKGQNASAATVSWVDNFAAPPFCRGRTSAAGNPCATTTLTAGTEEGAFYITNISPNTITLATNGATAAGNSTLSFASSVQDSGHLIGKTVTNVTHPTSIPAGTYVRTQTATAIGLSQTVAAPGVSNGDTITFTGNDAVWFDADGITIGGQRNAFIPAGQGIVSFDKTGTATYNMSFNSHASDSLDFQSCNDVGQVCLAHGAVPAMRFYVSAGAAGPIMQLNYDRTMTMNFADGGAGSRKVCLDAFNRFTTTGCP